VEGPGERDAYEALVRSALQSVLYPSLLADHPLAHAVGGEELRRLLLAGVDRLRPVARAEVVSGLARQHRHLTRRYLEGRTREEIADAEGISVRQAVRDHQKGLEAVASYLQSRGVRPARNAPAPPPGPPDEADDADLEEVARVSAREDRSTDVASVVVGVLSTLEAHAAERGVALVGSLAPGLPPVAVGQTVLRQALLNLLIYAVSVAPPGQLQIVAVDADRGVTLRAGASAEIPVATAADAEGTELLLAGARLLAAQGGTAEAGAGALVTIVLPPVPLWTVLLVDDNPDLAALLQRYLRARGCRVVGATTGEEALDLAQRLKPDLILLDVLLPAQDGWDVLRQLRAVPELRETPVAVCSVLREEALAHALGVREFLPKPIKREALLALIERVQATRPIAASA
jgi:CheY-like chemotaxis protein